MRKWFFGAGLTLVVVLLAAGCGSDRPAAVAPAETGEPGECIVMPGHMAKTDFHVEHEGETIYFCCAWCIGEFQADPDKYLSGGAAETAGHHHH